MHDVRGIDMTFWCCIGLQLERLKTKSLLERLGGVKMGIGIHGLWLAFCIGEIEYGELEYQCWVYEAKSQSELVETSS